MKNEYQYSSIYTNIDEFILDTKSTYIFGHTLEDRSYAESSLRTQQNSNIHFIELADIGKKDVIIDVLTRQEYSLKSSFQICSLLQKHKVENLYIDVTGLDCRVCASLIKNAIECYRKGLFTNIKVVYVEPERYDIKSFKSESVFNDLSEQIEGVEPLPGFATIFSDEDSESFLIALLGFEGGRFIHMLENVQIPNDKIIPIIGMPGFRLEYPFAAYWGNRRPLEDTGSWRQIKFASANSLFDVFVLLKDIIQKDTSFRIKVAPIGTKPHAIGAMLFAIKYPERVELVYDNPLRKKSRSKGIGNVIECTISKLIDN